MEYLFFALAAFGIVFIIMLSGWIQEKRNERKFTKFLRADYGSLPKREYVAEQYQNISHYFWRKKKGFFIDDITWHDLEMDEIFKRMNHTYSSAGEEYLYYLLRSPCIDKNVLQKREEIITYFRNNPNDRVRWQFLYARIGRTGKYSIYDYLGYLDKLGKRSNIPHYFSIISFVAAILLITISPAIGVAALFVILANNLLSYFRFKKEIEPYIVCFSYIFRVLDSIRGMEKKRLPILNEKIDEMAALKAAFKRFKFGSYILMSPTRLNSGANPVEIILDYLRMGLHLDLIKFNQMLSEVKKHGDKIESILTIMGEIEAMIAIGAFRVKLQYCLPVFTKDKEINFTNIYHPLLTEPVKNDFTVKKSILLTGSNASGKSTFLKTIAVNAILAQSINTCTADSYQAGMFYIATSMSLKDDIIAGDSYYMVEIKSMKRLIELGTGQKGEIPALVLVDEVLRGTNTVERIAASTQILKSLNSGNNVCIAATHDIELTYLLADKFENHHFEEKFIDDDIYFPYKILAGPATTRNAIKLLKVMGYDKELVADAEKLAEKFMKSGKWKSD
ncbi:MAG: hypothetical protein FWG91_08075 [Lachnospiraceae bacterium]|nr:hypothetical protein [Lachnospiraceae bacterium]